MPEDDCKEMFFIMDQYNKLLEEHKAILQTIRRLNLQGYLSRNMKKVTGKEINWV